MKALPFALAAVVLSMGVGGAVAANSTRIVTANPGHATCKVSPDRKIQKCTYVGQDSYGNAVY